MEYLVTGRQAKAIDTYTIEQTGIPSLVLMERASLCVAEEVQKQPIRCIFLLSESLSSAAAATMAGTASLLPEFFTKEAWMSVFSLRAKERKCPPIVRNN